MMEIIEGEIVGDELARIDDGDPSPTPPPRVLWLREVGRRVLRATGRGATDIAIRAARGAVLYPKTALVGTGSLLALPVTSGEVAPFVVGASVILVGVPATRSRLLSLAQANKYRQRKRRIKKRWVTVAKDASLARVGKADEEIRVPKLFAFEPTAVGVRFAADGRNVGASLSKFNAAADVLRVSLDAWAIDIRPHSSRPASVIVNLLYDDPFASIFPVATLPPPTRHLGVVVGYDAYGVAVEKDLYLPTLIAGMQGAGKSSEIWVILRGLIESGIPFRLRVFDPKGGQEFADLEDVAYIYERNPNKWAKFLEDAFASLVFQRERLRKKGLKDAEYTIENPLDIMIIDELLTVQALNTRRKTINMDGEEVALPDAWLAYLSAIRSAGFTVVACTQLTQKEILGVARDLFPNITLLRVESDDAVRAMGFEPKLYPAHELPRTKETAGIGFMKTEIGGVKYRAAYMTTEERAALAKEIAKTQNYYRAVKEEARERAEARRATRARQPRGKRGSTS